MKVIPYVMLMQTRFDSLGCTSGREGYAYHVSTVLFKSGSYLLAKWSYKVTIIISIRIFKNQCSGSVLGVPDSDPLLSERIQIWLRIRNLPSIWKKYLNFTGKIGSRTDWIHDCDLPPLNTEKMSSFLGP
jgi:hypothetical protein